MKTRTLKRFLAGITAAAMVLTYTSLPADISSTDIFSVYAEELEPSEQTEPAEQNEQTEPAEQNEQAENNETASANENEPVQEPQEADPAAAVQAMIDALPSPYEAEYYSEEELHELIDAVYDAMYQLSPEEEEMLDLTKLYELETALIFRVPYCVDVQPEPEMQYSEFITALPRSYSWMAVGETKNDYSSDYFGSQLSGISRTLYEALCNNIDTLKEGKTISVVIAETTLTSNTSDELRAELNAFKASHTAELMDSVNASLNAAAAFDRDHSEVFWGSGVTYSPSTYFQNKEEAKNYDDGTYSYGPNSTICCVVNIGIGQNKYTYWSENHGGISGVETTVSSKVTALVNEAKDTYPADKYNQLKHIHDWLTTHNHYGQANNESLYYQWEALGALDETLSPVCEGYSRAFKLCCDELGIPCILVSGLGTNSSGESEGHMWNYVQLDDNWYAVDVTWDDPTSSSDAGALNSGHERDIYFLKGSTSFTSDKHSNSGNDFLKSTHQAFGYPELSTADYDPANAHTHNWAYTAVDNTITATCSVDTPHTASITLSAPANTTYTGKPIAASVSNWSNTSYGLAKPSIEYFGWSESDNDYNVTLSGAPSDEGKYKAQITAGTATVNVTYTITKETAAIIKSPTGNTLTYTGSPQTLISISTGMASGGEMKYSLDGTDWTATLPTATDADTYTVHYKVFGDATHKDSAEQTITVTINKADARYSTEPAAITGLVYDGTEKALISAGTSTFGDVLYSTDGGSTWSTDIPKATAASSYTVKYKVEGTSNYNGIAEKSLTAFIAKASSAGITAPQAVTGLVYSNEDKALVTAGSATNGRTMEYKLEESGTYGNSVPTGTNAGTYKVYYKVSGGGNYEDYESAEPITVTIAKADPTVTAPAANTITYDGSEHELVTAGTASGGTMQYKLEGGTYGTVIPTGTNAGSYTVYYKVVGNENYNDAAERSITVNIGKADSSVTTPPAARTLTYSGSAQALVTEGTASGGAMQYKLNDGTYGTTIPTGTNAVSYTVYYKVVGDANHNDTAEESITVNIAKATPAYSSAPSAKTLTYTGSPQELVTAGVTSHGTLQYKLGSTGTWSMTVPTATNAGNYEVYHKIVGDANHNDTAEGLNHVTIGKADPSITTPPAAKTLTYNGSAQELVTAGTASGGTIQYKLESGAYGTDIPAATIAGEYTVYYKVVGDSNHNDLTNETTQKVTVTIGQAVAAVTAAPAANTITYDGSEHELVTAGTTSDGTMQYKLGDSGSWSGDIPKATTAGDYTVYYKVDGDSNHSDSAPVSVAAKINKAAPSVENVTYTGDIFTSTPVATVNTAIDGSASKSVPGTLALDVSTFVQTGEREYNWTFTPNDNTNYNIVTGKIRLNVQENALVSIAVTTMPTKTAYVYGDTLDKTGMIVTATYANGEEHTIPNDSIAVGGTLSVGQTTATVSYTSDGIRKEAEVTGLTVTPRPVTASVTASNKVYDGTTAAAVTITAPTGIVGESLTVTAPDAAFADADVGTGKTITLGTPVVAAGSGTLASNYTITYSPASPSADITQKPLTITAKAQTISYGDDIAAGTSQVTVSGLVSGDSLTSITLTQNGTSIVPSAAVIANGESNYSITYNNGVLTINKAVLTITAASLETKTFDGSSRGAVSGITFEKANGTAVALTNGTDYTATVVYDSSNAGSGKTALITVTLKGSAVNNYTLSSASYSLTGQTINKAAAINVSDKNITRISTSTGGTVSLSGLMPPNAGTLTYSKGTETKTGAVSIDSFEISEDGTVTYTISNGEVDDTITLPVTISSENYEDSSLNINITLTNKENQAAPSAFTVIFTLNDDEETYTAVIPAVAGAVYSFDGGSTWSDANTKTDVAPGETITASCKISATSELNESDPVSSTGTAPLLQVKAPAISPNGGEVTFPKTVSISCGTAGAEIYYTTDGSTPTVSSALYSGSFELTAAATVKAISVKDGMRDSSVVSAVFTLYVEPPVVPEEPAKPSRPVTPSNPVTPSENTNNNSSGASAPNPGNVPPVISSSSSSNSSSFEPALADNDGKSGWDAIADEIDALIDTLGNSESDNEIVVNMNGASEVPKSILKKIKGKDIDLVLNMGNGITWVINGTNVKTPKTIDLGVKQGTKNIPADVISTLKENAKDIVKQITLKYNGKFGLTAEMIIDLGSASNGKFANLYYYNPKTGEMEFVDCSRITDGRARLLFSHASDYAILITNEPKGEYDSAAAGAGITFDYDEITFGNKKVPVIAVIIIISAVIAALTAVIIVFKRKRARK